MKAKSTIAVTAMLSGLCLSADANASWSAPQLLSTGGQGWEAAGAIDGNSNSVAVWIERTASPDQIWSSSEPAGGGFGPATPVYAPAFETDLLLPQVRISAAGFAAAIWLDTSGLWTASRPAASAWSSPQLLSSDPSLVRNASADPSLEPVFKMNSGGDAVVVWLGGTSVVAVTRPAGGTWTSPQTVASPGGGTGVKLGHAAISTNGTVIATWDAFQIICTTVYGRRRCHDANFVLHASRRDPVTDTWIDSGALSGPNGSAHTSRVALDATGRAILVTLNAGVYVSATQGASGGAWSAFQTAASPGNFTLGTDLASDDAGDVTLVYDVGASQIVAVSGSTGTNAWASPVTVSGPNTGGGLVSLALAPNGNALIDWMAGGSSNPEVVAAFRATATGSWGSPIVVSGPGCSSVGGSCTPEALAVSSSGHGLIIYSGYDAAQVHTEYATNFQP